MFCWDQPPFWLIWLKLPVKLDLRFDDEDDYEYEIFSIPSRARAWASVILTGKRDSRRHSATWYSKTTAGTSYQMWEVFNILRSGEGLTSFSMEIAVLTFLVKKKGKMKLSGVSFFFFFENTRKNLKLNVVPFLVLKSKALIPSNPQLYLH